MCHACRIPSAGPPFVSFAKAARWAGARRGRGEEGPGAHLRTPFGDQVGVARLLMLQAVEGPRHPALGGVSE